MTKDALQDFINTLGYIPILNEGDHDSPKEGACVMEMVSYLDNDWTDTPSCTMGFISQTAQLVNDFLLDGSRHMILSQFDRLFGTFDLEVEEHKTVFLKKMIPVIVKWAKIANEQGLNRLFSGLVESDPAFWEERIIAGIKTFIADAEKGLIPEDWDETKALDLIERIMRHHEITDQQSIDILSDILDVADEVLGREEAAPVDKSRLKDLEALRPIYYTEVKYESA